MRNLLFTTILLFSFGSPKINSQTTNTTIGTKNISLENIWNGSFSTQRMNALNSMNGDFYSLLNFDSANNSTRIDVYSYQTLEKVKTLVNSKNIDGLARFSSYRFNNDETKLILGTNFEKIYRRSFKGTFYAYDIASKKVSLIGKNIQEPVFAPDNKKVAFAKDNNVYIKNLHTNKVTQITKDGKKNQIINGITDWVYEEEFGFVRAFEWSNDSKHIAFLRF